MVKKELIEKLTLLHQSGDPERAHSMADDMLLDYINDPEIKAAFEEVPRWYS